VDGSVAAAKLLYLAQNPAFLSSLIGLALGSNGQQTVPVGPGNVSVPAGAFMNLAANLVGQVAQDADDLAGDAADLGDAYLRDGEGCLTCDPATPRQRADALLQLLQGEDESFSALVGLPEEEPDWEYGPESWGDDEW
jgi:hypothetical protein